MSFLAGCTLVAPLGGLSDGLDGEGGVDAPATGDAAPSNDGAPQDALLVPDQVVIGPGEGGGPAPEGGPPKDAGCTTLCSCNNGSDCPKGVCANSLTVGSSLFSAAGANNFCTLACCTSADCPAGTVCYASGQGGQYCVAPSWVGRSAPGSAVGGTTCSSDSACRSGLCAAGRCADTCCSLASSASQCGGGTVCAFGAFPGRTSFDTHFAPHCQPQVGSLGFGASCSNSSQCRGGLCYQSTGAGNCTNPCEGSGECGPGNGCQIDQQGSDLYFACFPTPGSIMEGQACTSDQQCAGYWCGSTNECTDVCLRNADCTVAGWYCRTEPDMGPNGTYNVLVCGP